VDGDAKKPKKPKKPKTAGENKDDDDNALEEERDGVPSSDDADAADADAIANFVEEHQIKVPADAPKPFITFQSAPFPKRLTAALLKQGYKTPFPDPSSGLAYRFNRERHRRGGQDGKRQDVRLFVTRVVSHR
jgi:hypothetical protein